MVGRILIVNAILLLVYMSLCFGIARFRDRLDTVDTAWGLGFVLAGWSAELESGSTRSLVIAMLVTVWGVRLSSHIWRRSRGKPDDPRYRELSREWRGNVWVQAYWRVFLLQGALVWLVSLPVVMATGRQLGGWSWLTLAGTLVWLAGFIIEATADRQLAVFIGRKDRPKVLQTGLWRYSRHPNYFGELVQWWGLGLIALQARYGWIGLAGPLVLSWLIIFVSGIPPIERRHHDDPEYRLYRERTSVLIPLPPRHASQ